MGSNRPAKGFTLEVDGNADDEPGSGFHQRIQGALTYPTDLVDMPGLLQGAILRSPHAHARLLRIDTERARCMPGVHAVVTAEDVPGLNRFGIVVRDQPVFCEDRVRYQGEAVAAVAANTRAQARAALAAIRVEYEPLPAVADAASAEERTPLHDDGNLLARQTFEQGDVERALAGCAVVVEHEYRTPRQMHAFMETEGGVAIPDGSGGVHFRVGCQAGHRDVGQLADILNLAPDQVSVDSMPTGGAFGGKDELTIQPVAGVLALKTGRPVMIHLDRFESCLAGMKRHPVAVKMTTGCDADGHLLAHRVEAILDTGAYASLGPAVLDNYLDSATGPLYRIGAYAVSGRLVYTNNGVCGAFRGFGGNQATFAVESQLDALARELNLCPGELRRINLRSADDLGSHRQPVRWTAPPADVLGEAMASPLWRLESGHQGRWRVGTGIAMGPQGNGLGNGLPDSGGGRLSLTREGRIRVEFGFVDYGQHLGEAVIRLVCRGLGCHRDDVELVLGDSRGPDSGRTSASRSVVLVQAVLARVLPQWAGTLRRQAAQRTGHGVEHLAPGPGGVFHRGRRVLGYRELAEDAAMAELVAEAHMDFPVAPVCKSSVGRYLQLQIATVARVVVDSLTGRVRVTDLHHVTAAGRVIYPAGYLGQIEGGAVMGLGMTLTEDMPARDGCLQSDNLDQYLIPTCQDAPTQRVDVLDETPEDDPFPVRGVGELGIEAVAPAIVSAIEAATGVRVRTLPVAAGDLLQAMHNQQAES